MCFIHNRCRKLKDTNFFYWKQNRKLKILQQRSTERCLSDCIVAVRLWLFMKHCCVFPTTQFAYRKYLGTCDALLCVSHTLQSALESGQGARIRQIDFSAAFDRVNYQGILYKRSSVGIGGSVLSVLTQFLFNRSQYVLLYGCRSKLVNVVSGAGL